MGRSREAGDGAHCGREGGKLYSDPIGGEVVARRAGGVRGQERSSVVRFCCSLTGARCSNQAEKYYMRGDGDIVYFLDYSYVFIQIAHSVQLHFTRIPVRSCTYI